MIIIVENDLPLLTVEIPERNLLQKININENIQIDIDYNGDADSLFYTLIIMYKFEVVATKEYEFTSFQFRIWELF